MKFLVTTKRLSALSVAVAASLAIASCASTSHATLLWYDGFSLSEYTSGGALTGASGGGTSGTFFDNPWITAGYPDPPTLNTLVLPAGLTRPGLITPAIGGAAGLANPPGCCHEQRVSRLMDVPWSGFTQPDGTFYVSFLADYGGGTNAEVQHRSFEMHDAGFGDNPNRNLMLGFMAFAQPDTHLLLAVRDDDTTVTGFKPLKVGNASVTLNNMDQQGTHLMVLKFEMSTSGNDVISAFLDPVGLVEPAPNAQITVGNFIADRMSAMAQFAYNGTPTSGILDEIRVGTTFADVANNSLAFAGIPEPGTFTLVGLALGCASLARRKRS